jgi:drug/metabolite transporter (DMT)-like permease
VDPSRDGKERLRGLAALSACAALWSCAGILIKLVSWNPVAIAGSRSLIAAALMLLALRRRPRFSLEPRLVLGAALYAATMLLFVAANKLTTSANAILLQYSCPAWTALGAVLILKERPRPLDLLFAALTVGAMVLFFLDRLSASGLLGNVLAILSGITFGLAFVFLRGQKDGTQEESLILSHLLSFAVAIPFFIFMGPPATAVSWIGIGLLGLFQIGLASILLSYGMRRVGALESVLTTSLEPVLNPVWVFFWNGELPGFWAIIGGGAIVLMVAIRPFLKTSPDISRQQRS